MLLLESGSIKKGKTLQNFSVKNSEVSKKFYKVFISAAAIIFSVTREKKSHEAALRRTA